MNKNPEINVSNTNEIIVNGKRKQVRDITLGELTQSFENLNIALENKIVKFSDILRKKEIESRVNTDIRDIIVSINTMGIINPLIIAEQENGKYLLVDGYRRYLSVETILKGKDLDKLGVTNPRFTGNPEMQVINLKKKDGKFLSEIECLIIAGTSNAQRKSWNPVDISNCYNNLLKMYLMQNYSNNPKVFATLENIGGVESTRILLFALLNAKVIKNPTEINKIMDRVSIEMMNIFSLTKEELPIYAKISEIPSNFSQIFYENNPYGYCLNPVKAIKVFFNKKGLLKSDEIIEKSLLFIKNKISGKAAATNKEISEAIKELPDADTDESEETIVWEKKSTLNKKEKGLFLAELSRNKSIKYNTEDVVKMLDAIIQNDFKKMMEIIKAKGIKLASAIVRK